MNPTQKITYKISRLLICLYTKFLLNMDVLWLSSLPSGPFLIVSNHPSTTDPFYLLSLFRKPFSILIIEHAFKAPLFGTFLRLSGHIPVVSTDKHAAFSSAHGHLLDGKSIAIFPEGDLSPRQGGSLPPRSGAARLALLTGLPVIPIGIYFQRDRARAFISKFKERTEIGYWYLRGPYAVTIGEPMQFQGNSEDRGHVRAISTTIMNAIDSLAIASQKRLEFAS